MALDVFNMKSVNGYPVDLLVSALQKFCRRGEERQAIHVAFELALTSTELEEHVWHRLLVICSEDIGSGNWMANTVVKDLYDTAKILYEPGSTSDRFIVMANAIRFICQCQKERCSCLLNDITKREVKNGKEIYLPDYVYDMHTKKGHEMGRGYDHFLDTASIVLPHSDCDETALKEELRALVNAEKNK